MRSKLTAFSNHIERWQTTLQRLFEGFLMSEDIRIRRFNRVQFRGLQKVATRNLLALLFVLAPTLSLAADYLLYTGQQFAQTQIDVNHRTTWTISTTGSVPAGAEFAGGVFTMKKGSSTTATITLSYYLGTNNQGTLLGSVSLTNSSFTGSFSEVAFRLA